jgi:hypothetical protein
LLDNPIASVQLRLRGGWKSLLINSGIYLLLAMGGLILWLQTADRNRPFVPGYFRTTLMAFELVIVIIFSIGRVSSAVRQDLLTGISESHRLMPINGITAAVGYILGPASQLFALAVTSFVAGLIACSVGGDSPDHWIVNNLIIVLFLLMVCAWSVLFGFYPKGLAPLLGVVGFLAFFSQGMIFYALPALSVLFTPLSRDSVFASRPFGDLITPELLEAFLMQGVLAALLLCGASRKFRRPDRAAFSAPLALLLLAVWIALNLMGVLQWGHFEPGFLRSIMWRQQQRECTQFVGSVITSLLLVLIPLFSAADGPQDIANSTRANSGIRFVLISILATAIICFLLIVPYVDTQIPAPLESRGIVAAAIAIACAVICLASVISVFRGRVKRCLWMIFLLVLFTWLVPLLIDVLVHALLPTSEDPDNLPWSITGFGPIGTLISPWHLEMQTRAGLMFQFGEAAGLLVLAFIVQLRRRPAQLEQIDSPALADAAASIP